MTLLVCFVAFSFFCASAASPRKIALLGDSMTWIGGDSCQNPTGWSHYLMKSGIAESIDVYARSGATWTNTSHTKAAPSFYSEVLHDDNVVYNQVLRLISNVAEGKAAVPDCIVIFAGANDAWFSSRRPGIFNHGNEALDIKYTSDTDVASATSLLSSVALVCDILKQSFPSASYLIVTPLQMSKVSEETVHVVSDIIEKSAGSRGFTVLRADNNVDIKHDVESKTPKHTYDGVHTNPDGARLVAQFIIPYLTTDN